MRRICEYEVIKFLFPLLRILLGGKYFAKYYVYCLHNSNFTYFALYEF